jgi:hypothetical protein
MTKIVLLALLTAALGFGRRPPIAIPQVADGEGWRTTIVVVNTFSLETAHISILFRGSTGARISFPLENYGVVSSLELDLPPQSSVFLESTGISSRVQSGWAEINQTTGAIPVKAFAVFRQMVPGRPDFEAVAPGMRGGESVIFPFDNTSGFATSFAAVNLSINDCSLGVSAMYEESGRALAVQPKLVGNLQPNGHLAFVSTDLIPELANKRGFLSFNFPTLACPEGTIVMMGLRFNPSGAFTNLLALSEPPQL